MSDFKRLSRSVKGLTVLVTGAASGMGRATALVFAGDGANVAVTDISAEATQAVAGEIAASGGSAKAWTLDVADRYNITSTSSMTSPRISAGSISSSTMPASPCASRSTTTVMTRPGPKDWP